MMMIELNNGQKIPQEGFETFQITDFDLTTDEINQLKLLDKKQWLSPNRHSLSSTQHYMDLIDEGLDY